MNNYYDGDLPYYLLFGYKKCVPTLLDRVHFIFKKMLFTLVIGYIAIQAVTYFL